MQGQPRGLLTLAKSLRISSYMGLSGHDAPQHKLGFKVTGENKYERLFHDGSSQEQEKLS